MSRSSRSNRQTGGDPDGHLYTSLNFFRFADWSCVGSSVREDFIHPSFAVQSPKSKSDSQQLSKHELHHGSSVNVRSPTQSESTEEEDSSKTKEIPTEDDVSSNHKPNKISTFFSKITFRGYAEGFENCSSVVNVGVGKATSSSKSSGQSHPSSAKGDDSVLCCDKCDAGHETDDCPYYKKQREIHLDGQKNGWKLVGGSSNLPGRPTISNTWKSF